ncbi:MAG: 50S ribosomal protein L11 methyltransferase [Rhodospirillales bacterium]|nr:50S ribosomal protein L11 methyltransferase [Rhodospirillales bacterium]
MSAVKSVLEQFCATVSWFEIDGSEWLLEGLATTEPDPTDLDVAVALAAASMGMEALAVTVELLPETDWLTHNRQQFPPLRIGRFLVYGSHIHEPVPRGCVGLCIDAATAFGSGHHASTGGCLMAIDGFAGRGVHRPLDLGCGSGILALAMAKLWRRPVLASDIDPHAVDMTAANARRNHLSPWVRAIGAEGLAAASIRAHAPYDMVAANILARPLRRLARELAALITPGGVVILSGFVAGDGGRILAAYRSQGMILARRITIDGWQTLVLRKSPKVAVQTR